MYKKQLNCPAFLFATWLKYSVKNKRICISCLYIFMAYFSCGKKRLENAGSLCSFCTHSKMIFQTLIKFMPYYY